MTGRLHMGFFAEWGGMGEVVLFSGGREALGELARRLRELEDRKTVPIALHELPFVTARGSIRVVAHPAGFEEGFRRTRDGAAEIDFDWYVNHEGWLEATEKIEAVAQGSGNGHAYLDTQSGADDASPMVSMGEYSDEWWAEHG